MHLLKEIMCVLLFMVINAVNLSFLNIQFVSKLMLG